MLVSHGDFLKNESKKWKGKGISDLEKTKYLIFNSSLASAMAF